MWLRLTVAIKVGFDTPKIYKGNSMKNRPARSSLQTALQKIGVVLLLVVGQAAISQEVMPDFYQEPGINPNRSYVEQNLSESVDPFSGALQLHYVDIHLPGNGGFDLKVTRSYNTAGVNSTSPASYKSLMGLGWTMHFGRVLRNKLSSDICLNTNAQKSIENPIIELPDGSRQQLAFTGTTQPLMLTRERWRAQCNVSGGSGLIVYSPDGVQYEMSQLVAEAGGPNPVNAWYARKITDRNGNFATINYASSASPEISSVTTNDGRTISFSYADAGTLSRRVISITSAGQTFTYGYQAIFGVNAYQLISVSRPGGTSWNYSYNGELSNTAGGYMLNKLTYPQNGFISYGYSYKNFDATAVSNTRSTVIATKTSSDGGNWSFAYTPGSVNVYDTTTVTSPAGITTYKHIGPNYAASGSVWMVGLLMQKSTGNLQVETYTWDKQQISPEQYSRTGYFTGRNDLVTYAPILINKVISRNGANYNTAFSGHDTYGNPATMVESGPSGGARTTALTYLIDTAKWIVKQRKNESFSGSSIVRNFDAAGNLTSIVRDGITTSYVYDVQGNVSSVTYPRSLTHYYSNYYRGAAQTENQPEGVNISRVVSAAGNVTSETNGDGFTTSYGYDGLNRLTSIAFPIGNPISIVYGATTRTATRGALIESTVYDGFGRTSSVTLGGVAQAYARDAMGRLTFASNPGNTSIGRAYQYDLLNRMTRQTNADGTFSLVTFGAGSVITTDERGKVTTSSYRSYGDPSQQILMQIVAPESGANITITRNTKDLVTSVAQAGVTRSYGYNANYHLTSVTNPETGVTAYGRDAAGNKTSSSIGSSGSTLYTYDNQNRLATVLYPGRTQPLIHAYNKQHRIISITSEFEPTGHGGNRAYIYDPNGNILSESLSGGMPAATATYTYTANDQLSTYLSPKFGELVSYNPDVLGRPTTVGRFVTNVTYHPSGQINQLTYANGSVSQYAQNSRLWPSTFVASKGAQTYANQSFTYDAVGNLSAINDAADSNYNKSFTYDNINRLTGATGLWGTGVIAYDGSGNITSQVFGSYGVYYAYDANNRLASISGSRVSNFAYDASGNVSSAHGLGYTYDGSQRLICVNCSDSFTRMQYQYDGSGARTRADSGYEPYFEMYDSQGKLLFESCNDDNCRNIEYYYLGGKRVAQRVLRLNGGGG
jgi:YD repeat-containing protein